MTTQYVIIITIISIVIVLGMLESTMLLFKCSPIVYYYESCILDMIQ